MNNYQEYLLGIAQKIVESYADQATTNKYYKLKKSLAGKYHSQRREPSQDIFRKSSRDMFRQSIALKQSKLSNIQDSRQSLGHSVNFNSKKQVDKYHQDIIGSKSAIKRQQKVELKQFEELSILNQLSKILKNAQSCPVLLKTLTISLQPKNVLIQNTIRNIQISLSKIYQSITQHSKVQQQLLTNSNKQLLPIEEIINDNKWLISKLEAIIRQNMTLRRMVGSKIY